MPRKPINLIEAFEQASRAKKIVSYEELGERLAQVAAGELPIKPHPYRDPAPFSLTEIQRILCGHYSADESYIWAGDHHLPQSPSEFAAGTVFKSGRAVAYDGLIDAANGYDFKWAELLTAFDACDNHAKYIRQGRLQPKRG